MGAVLYADRVKETTSTTGTGTVSLAGAATGYRAFQSVYANNAVVYYCITNGVDWEVGKGTFLTPPSNQITRDIVFSSSNAGALVNFGVGTKDVLVVDPAQAIADLGLTIATHALLIPQ